MKRFIFAFMTMLLTLTVASARSFDVPLQTDVGYSFVTTVQHSDFTPAFADVTFETTAVVQVQAVSFKGYNQNEIRLCVSPAYCNPDYGLKNLNENSISGICLNKNRLITSHQFKCETAKQIPKLE